MAGEADSATVISALLAVRCAERETATAAWIPAFCRLQDGYKLDIRTGDGSVDLVLPSDFQTNIDASTAMAISAWHPRDG